MRSDPGSVDGFFTLPSWDATAFSRARWYVPLDKLIHSDATAPDWDFADFFPNIAKIHVVAGEQIGMPITIELQALFCNKAMLAAKQLIAPATLDALMGTATKLKNKRRIRHRHAWRRRAGRLYFRSVPVRVRRALAGREGHPRTWQHGDGECAEILRRPAARRGTAEHSRHAVEEHLSAVSAGTCRNVHRRDEFPYVFQGSLAVARGRSGCCRAAARRPIRCTQHGDLVGAGYRRLIEAAGGHVDGDPMAHIEEGDDRIDPGHASAAFAAVDLQQRCLYAVGACRT